MKKHFDEYSNLDTFEDSTILWTFQNKKAVKELLTKGKLIAKNDFIYKENLESYRYIILKMEEKGIKCYGHPPVWAWHSCEGYQKPPSFDTARSLLSDIEIKNGIQLIKFQCPNDLIMLTNYHGWCNIYFDFFENNETNVKSDALNYLFNLYPKHEAEWENHYIQATLPYLKKEWIIKITEIDKINVFNR
ncbi:DUF3841 domain-containing protein [Bacillus thuringiensis]|uniref:Uncharacterized protein n=1 Tax=Bacillus thuringiensis TaxID=1428 RepID=A0A9W3TCY3_BACTU|nr:DUF3841 domain-containing protein [Bacillus thuringiensis]AQY39123.1 hypothetical protein B4918_14615 [Bacillus thuringiensis]MDR4150843.1 DUF3841 domain-containing protein [Bacillus thuringiensis]MEC3573794.1 DUF3841 domain-containing protein [Bacillus thuringiensis]MED2022409.1 DUF3841 domain-containing protein [Bacillus thuringiensis]MED2143656.1 DUF3841 domain-containing protein [Bacillus thuringiensis]